MAKFVFKLEGVLKHRQHVEAEKKRLLAHVQAQFQALENDLRALDESVKKISGDVRDNRLIGKLDMNFLAAHRRYVNAMQRRAMQLATKMAHVQRLVDEARANLAEAAKQRKILEKLREKQEAAWRAELDRKEAIELDEIGMQLSYYHGGGEARA